MGRLLFYSGEGGIDSMLRISPRHGRGSNAIACCLNGSAIVRTLCRVLIPPRYKCGRMETKKAPVFC